VTLITLFQTTPIAAVRQTDSDACRAAPAFITLCLKWWPVVLPLFEKVAFSGFLLGNREKKAVVANDDSSCLGGKMAGKMNEAGTVKNEETEGGRRRLISDLCALRVSVVKGDPGANRKAKQGNARVFDTPPGIPRFIPHIHQPGNAKTLIFNRFATFPLPNFVPFLPLKTRDF
jgi:hypothetical protein